MEILNTKAINKLEHIRFVKIHEDAKVPTKGTEGAAAYDLYSVEDLTIEPQDVALIHTGLKIILPCCFELQVRPRGGLALKHKISVLNSPGTVDEDYRGEVGVILYNFGKEPFKVEKGMRIAQAKISACVSGMDFIEVTTEEYDADKTERGTGAYASTGLK